MIGALLGLPGKIKTVYDYLTTNLAAVRAAKIDNLDAAMTTRAAASTALSTAQWTNTRAGYLDNIATASPIDRVPIANGLVRHLATYMSTGTITLAGAQGLDVATIGIGAATYSYTGSGVIEFAAIQNHNVTAANNLTGISLVIDGVTVITGPTIPGGSKYVFQMIGQICSNAFWNGTAIAYNQPIISFSQVPFKTGFTINATGMASANGLFAVAFRKTS